MDYLPIERQYPYPTASQILGNLFQNTGLGTVADVITNGLNALHNDLN